MEAHGLPSRLTHLVDGFSRPLGAIEVFDNPGNSINSTISNPNKLIYASGGGIANYSVDYRLSYSIPITASAGDYESRGSMTAIAGEFAIAFAGNPVGITRRVSDSFAIVPNHPA